MAGAELPVIESSQSIEATQTYPKRRANPLAADGLIVRLYATTIS
jgi:hypothetical protein